MAQNGAGLVLPPKKALWLRQQQQQQTQVVATEPPSSEEKDSTSTTSSTPPATPSQPEQDTATTTTPTKLGPSRKKKRKRTELDFLQATDFSLGRSLGSRNTFTSVIAGLLPHDEKRKKQDEEKLQEQLLQKTNQNLKLPDPMLLSNTTLVLFHRPTFKKNLSQFVHTNKPNAQK
ncbi:hypothetical protein QOT17_018259 [Balamuthia mandrillaris]